ncbi:MAG: hypothetical protein KIY12_10285 [Thermoplasmata archaeon]|uniref:Uncharacterized protein n=1 Tax=Candidatus Sysuiplasma superficiale TaxID=2823368 RepID=A0A8J7YNC4_9ARCH|nr:hypothetical protein [Candidatus Sysuiplasma superficiale]MBX8645085.1 hypothetical protein [Candidatus Sysuiplasma superficiale]
MEDEVKEKIEQFGGLIDEQTARMLIEYERGAMTPDKREKLKAKLDKSFNSKEEALVLEVNEPHRYRRRDGTDGTVLSIKIFIEGREASLTFWDSQIEKVCMKYLVGGSKLHLINCHRTEGRYGLQINTGKGGIVATDSGEIIYK